MAEKVWETIKVQFCEHAGCEVSLDGQMVYAAEFLPDQPPRIIAHRCSRAMECALFNQPACVWAGTNPAYDPFAEKEEKAAKEPVA